MQPNLPEIEDSMSSTDYQLQNSLITTIKKRFHTYGFQETGTKTFQDYDLYASMIGTVHKHNMIKTIDSSGDVLVLRPDVTIPITRKIASEEKTYDRLFYVENIFRQPNDGGRHKEFTQAGVECFGENSPDNDAEMVALAVHILQDLKFNQFKIEIGHAGFFKDLIDELPLSAQESEKLQELIKSKNLTEIDPFLKNLPVEDQVVQAIRTIPMLYGSPQQVIETAETITLNGKMNETIENLKQVYAVLKAYEIEDSVVFDLGLINHMNYYSGIIFQGYVTGYSKPVLMGGRYNNLAEQFGRKMPAIGFGCIVDDLLQARKENGHLPAVDQSIELKIHYDKTRIKDALSAANRLRDSGYQVIAQNNEMNSNTNVPILFTVHFEKEDSVLLHQQKQTEFRSTDELKYLLQKEMRET